MRFSTFAHLTAWLVPWWAADGTSARAWLLLAVATLNGIVIGDRFATWVARRWGLTDQYPTEGPTDETT